MHSISYFWKLSRAIYRPKKFSESKRAFVFFVRSISNRQLMEDLYTFFHNYKPLPDFLEHDRDFQEVMTRVFLFKNSTMEQRLEALVHHFEILQAFFSDDAIHELYLGQGIPLWTSSDENLPLEARLRFDTGQRKEGFLTLGLNYEGEGVYHFNFRFDYNSQGKPSLYVGTLQGTKHGLDTTRALTKKLYGYRPKNFILYLLRIFTQTLGIENLYVITDDSFYTNSHVLRGNRSKKRSSTTFGSKKAPHPQRTKYITSLCPSKKSAASTQKSNRRSATSSASVISSWIRSCRLMSKPSTPRSAMVSCQPQPIQMKPYWIMPKATIPSKHPSIRKNNCSSQVTTRGAISIYSVLYY